MGQIAIEEYQVVGKYNGFIVMRAGKKVFEKEVKNILQSSSKVKNRILVRDWYIAAKSEVMTSINAREGESDLFRRLQKLTVK